MLTSMSEQDLREQLVTVARRMQASGINQGTSGNLSVRIPGGMLITPSSLPYELMQPSDLVALDLAGKPLHPAEPGRPQRRPSSEWRLHADVLANRPEVQAVLHWSGTEKEMALEIVKERSRGKPCVEAAATARTDALTSTSMGPTSDRGLL